MWLGTLASPSGVNQFPPTTSYSIIPPYHYGYLLPCYGLSLLVTSGIICCHNTVCDEHKLAGYHDRAPLGDGRYDVTASANRPFQFELSTYQHQLLVLLLPFRFNKRPQTPSGGGGDQFPPTTSYSIIPPYHSMRQADVITPM